LLTNTTPGSGVTKRQDPKEVFNGLPGMTSEFLEDFMAGIEFGSFERQTNFKWKHGNPWLYPYDEFLMLKTAIRGFALAGEKVLEKSRKPKIVMPEADSQKSISREKAYQEFLNKRAS
jgi:hypothetical protein